MKPQNCHKEHDNLVMLPDLPCFWATGLETSKPPPFPSRLLQGLVHLPLESIKKAPRGCRGLLSLGKSLSQGWMVVVSWHDFGISMTCKVRVVSRFEPRPRSFCLSMSCCSLLGPEPSQNDPTSRNDLCLLHLWCGK